MQPPDHNPQQQRFVLAGLVLLTLGAALLKPFTFLAPEPLQAAPTQLALARHQARNLNASSPPHRNAAISHGSGQRYQLQSAPPLTLTLVPVRFRLFSELDLTAFADPIHPLASQVGMANHDLQQLDGDELAFDGPSSGPAITRLQTCLTASGRSGVSRDTLLRHLSAERDAAWQRGSLQVVASRLLGTAPSARWECLLVTLETSSDAGSRKRLISAWRDFAASLRS